QPLLFSGFGDASANIGAELNHGMLLFRVRPDFPKFSRFRIEISPWTQVERSQSARFARGL
ncbi:MAG: hypothetical protein KA750_00695, partial [Thermoflexales bacterium]|nr:hypothetical protein [Thermoflexales bacterium]